MRAGRIGQGLLVIGAVLLGLLAGTGVAAAAPPSNDAFASPTVLGASGTRNGSNVDATTEVDEPTIGGILARHSVWFTWTAPADGFLVASTIGSSIDTHLAIYEGATLATLDQLAAQQYTGGDEGGRALAEVQSGQTYFVQVASEGDGDTGAYKLAWRLAQSPANDDFAAAQVVPGAGGVVSGATNVGATTEEDEPAHNSTTAQRSVWFRWTAVADGFVVFDTYDADFDPVLGAYEGTEIGNLVEVADNDDGGPQSLNPRVSFIAEAGTTYHIAVDGYEDNIAHQVGSFLLAVNRVGFTDVSRSHPFWRSIEFAAFAEITTGYPDGTFRPAASITRGAMSAFVYRLDGESPGAFTPPPTPTFSDVPASHPFYREIEWMYEEEITTGYPDGTYRSQTSVSRAAMSAFLFRLSGDTYEDPLTAGFDDVPTDHPFFTEIEWMEDEGISEGYSDGTFRPGAPVSRGAMAAFVDRYYQG
jgi:hypothetical protein